MRARESSEAPNEGQPEASHLVIRFSDVLSGVATIAEHQRVIARSKAVWMAKFGRGLSPAKMNALGRQIKRGIATYVFLVTRCHAEYAWYRGTLLDMASEPPERETGLIPEYYQREGMMLSVSRASSTQA